MERVIDVLKLSYYDPVIVGEAARGLSIIAKGKGEDKSSHLTAKVSSTIAHIAILDQAEMYPAIMGSENVEFRSSEIDAR